MKRVDLETSLGHSLDDEQWDVISAPLLPAVVVAGAGSGKTTSMSLRIAYLVGNEEVRADRVMGLTFTNKAVGQLLANIRERLADVPLTDDDDDRGDPNIATYNAFAGRIVSEHGLRLGREGSSRLLTDGARHQLAYRTVCRTSLDLSTLGMSPVDLTNALLGLDDELSNLDLQPEQLIAHETAALVSLAPHHPLQVKAHGIEETIKQRRALAELLLQWREAKAARDVMDFADQTRLALVIVRRFPEVAMALRAASDLVILDEYQDTNIAQRLLIQVIYGDGFPVTAVGDPAQAIYGWRGASVDNIESFVQHFSWTREGVEHRPLRYPLMRNWRSGAAILGVANEVSAPLRQRHVGLGELTFGAQRKGQGSVRCGLFATSLEERAWIADDIASLRGRVPLRDIAVLAGVGSELSAVEAELQLRGIPTQRHGAAGLLRQPAVVELRSMLEVMHSSMANPALVRVLTGARWRIGARDLAALGRRAADLAGRSQRTEGHNVNEALDAAVEGADPSESVSLVDAVLDLGPSEKYAPEAFTRFEAFAAELRMLRRRAGEPVPELLSTMLDVTGLETELAMRDASSQQVAVSAFLEFAADFTDLDGAASLGAFLARLRDAERFDVDLPIDYERREDAVQLLTIYKAKGLEYSHVYLPSLAKSAFPGGQARGSWIGKPSIAPWPIRQDATYELREWLHAEGPKDKHVKAYLDVLRDVDNAETQRLLYVALTRAEHSLTVTGHWWGPRQSRLRGPGPFLVSVHTACQEWGEVITWADEPLDGETNPSPGAEMQIGVWPAAVESARDLRVIADRVIAAQAAPQELPGMPVASPALTDADRARIASWDLDISVLTAEERARRAPVRTVALPESVSASLMIEAIRNPDSVAQALARPMPNAPAPAAKRGTAFHLWAEQRLMRASSGAQLALIDPDDVPGAADDVFISTDEQLDALKEAFMRTPYDGRQAIAIEAPFAIVIGGRVVRGRIDAVFQDPDTGRFEVVDWKTGSAQGVDELQLAIYRQAWAQVVGCDLDDVDAAFLIVPTGEILRPTDLPALDAILPP